MFDSGKESAGKGRRLARNKPNDVCGGLFGILAGSLVADDFQPVTAGFVKVQTESQDRRKCHDHGFDS
jgi:hypothetical protein